MTRLVRAVAVAAAATCLLAAPARVTAADAPPPAPAARTAATANAASTGTDKSRGPAVDRLQLDATSITGNRELPKVMSIVPWKGAEPPAGPDRPMGSLIEELLAPLDRDEFRREITYYGDLTSQSALPIAAPGAPKP
jgi:hypothetical protein